MFFEGAPQGVIVFDEIQDLSEAKSGGATRMLNFFVQLENTLGIPFVLIATPKAKPLLSGEFRQARRISEQGDIYWRPMRQFRQKKKPDERDVVDPDWNDFVRAMWRYWYLRKAHPLPQNLLDEPVIKTLYEQSKGITALVVTIFFLAQRRAIVSSKEDLTDPIVKSVVQDNQYFINQVLNQIKEPPPTKRGHNPVSDLDKSAWQSHQSPPDTQGTIEQQKDCIGRSSPKGVPGNGETNSSSVKVRKSLKEKEDAPAYEDEDFRSLKTGQADEGLNNSSAINNFFASIDKLS